MPIPTSQPKPSLRLRRIAGSFLLAGLVLIVLGMLALFFVTPLSVWAANRLLPGWLVSVERMTIQAHGGLTLRGVKVRLRSDGSDVLSADKAGISFSWRGLRTRHLIAVDVTGLRISANDAVLAEAQKILVADGSKDSGWSIDLLNVRGGSVKVAPPARRRAPASLPSFPPVLARRRPISRPIWRLAPCSGATSSPSI